MTCRDALQVLIDADAWLWACWIVLSPFAGCAATYGLLRWHWRDAIKLDAHLKFGLRRMTHGTDIDATRS